MDKKISKKLQTRNDTIIKAILDKMKSCCPGSVALIGIAGSFSRGEFHEKSDLDLCIITEDEKAKKLETCFILGDVAHDIYCSSWKRIEDMAEYNNPHISKLFELEIVYKKDEKVLERYLNLRKKVESKLRDTKGNFDKAKGHLDNALKEYGKVMISDNLTDCLSSVFEMVVLLEYVVYMLNNAYIKKGIKGIPGEIKSMKLLPDNFAKYYDLLFKCRGLDEIKSASTKIIKNVRDYIEEFELKMVKNKELTSDDLTGTYEENYSNWRNKMYLASDENDRYLSFMTMASCQQFYNEMADEFDIPRIKMIQNYNPGDLVQTAKSFDMAMEEWRKLYDKFNKPIVKYSRLNEFLEGYLRG